MKHRRILLFLAIGLNSCSGGGKSVPPSPKPAESDQTAVEPQTSAYMELTVSSTILPEFEVKEKDFESVLTLLEAEFDSFKMVSIKVPISYETGSSVKLDFRLRNASVKTILDVIAEQSGVSYRLTDSEIIFGMLTHDIK